MLLNFLGNAIKFSERGSIVIRVRAVRAFGHETLVRFEVRDHGIGIDPAEVAQLFTPFHQADPSTTRRYGGTGLGLVISKQLAELMGGEVGVDSQPGRGSTFWFTARLGQGGRQESRLARKHEDGHESRLEPKPEPDARPSRRSGASGLPAVRLDGKTILLVEDNVFSQQVGCELLQGVGASVVVAGNGSEAIERMRERRFDCVLMDVQMPVMDGFEATRRVRADEGLRHTVVIAMTANAGVEDQRRCMEAGMDDFLTKPVAPELLATTILRVLARVGTRQEQGVAASASAAASTPDPVPAVAPAAARTVSAPTPPADSPAAPPTAAGMPLLDVQVLAATFGHDPDKMRKFAFMFLDSVREGMAEIDIALASNDLARAGAVAHRLKSSARGRGDGLCRGLLRTRTPARARRPGPGACAWSASAQHLCAARSASGSRTWCARHGLALSEAGIEGQPFAAPAKRVSCCA
ncbi:ATP-binding protein [Massilia sp. Dwa41.01b]|uniref:hybrid sensor histidine kinase/response regulator n=1 Tax=Massilia sp. Dwa41.01b TaxID=2709302 RepID=UPI001E3C39BC|nr:ATP-binding protein [Massilia sp. Dwa41.01b]